MHSPDEWQQSPRIRMPRRWWTRLTLGGARPGGCSPPLPGRTTVRRRPGSEPHRNDISNIADAGITGGCAPGLYCPSTGRDP